jgi:hypothetical protein
MDETGPWGPCHSVRPGVSAGGHRARSWRGGCLLVEGSEVAGSTGKEPMGCGLPVGHGAVVRGSPMGHIDGGAEKNGGAVEFGWWRRKSMSGGGLRAVLQLGWGEDKLSRLGIGEERHEERPSSAKATAASPCDFGVMIGSSVVGLGQEDSSRVKRPWGELVAKSDAWGWKNWATAALGTF